MKKYLHALLLGNAENVSHDHFRKLVQKADFILAVDGGANRALKAGITPNAIIGDLDSLSVTTRKKFPSSALIEVSRQDNTDLEKALNWLLQHQYTDCTLCGFIGGRVDFTLGNILSLYPYAHKLNITVCGAGWKLIPVTKSLSLPCCPGKRVSLLPYKTCRNVSSTGLKYPLKKVSLSWKQAGRSLSNQTTGKRFSVSLSSGFLWLYIED